MGILKEFKRILKREMKAAIFFVALLLGQSVGLFIFGVKAEEVDSSSYPGNRCLSFDGVDDYLTCGYYAIYRLDNLTVEAWVKPMYNIHYGSDAQYEHTLGFVVSRGGSTSIPGYCLYFEYSTGLLHFQFYGDSTHSFHASRDHWFNSSWYHIAVTYDRTLPSGNLKFYLNGTMDSEHDIDETIVNGDYSLAIGKYVANIVASPYGGFIDEVRVWNVSRSQDEIRETCHRILNASETSSPHLIGYWRLDEGNGMQSQDHSIYGNNANLATTPANPQWIPEGAPIIPEFFSISTQLLAVITFSTALVLQGRRMRRQSEHERHKADN